jgi:hypothetical protein
MNPHSPDAATPMGYSAEAVAPAGEGQGLNYGQIGRVLNAALVEIIGSDAAASLGNLQGMPDLARELEARFGQSAGRGIALRVGGACFAQFVRQFGDLAGLTQPAFRLLPLRLRLRQGLLAFRGLLAEFAGKGVRVEDQDGRLFWRLQDCPLCVGHQVSEPICYLMLGMMKAALAWLGGGKVFDVREIACRGRGDDDCVFLIDPTPVEE